MLTLKTTLIGAAATTLLAVGTLAILDNKPANSTFDLPGLGQQVQHQGEVLDNHEARITNNESAIVTLQGAVPAATAPVKVDVPVVSQAPVVAPVTPAPVDPPVTPLIPKPAPPLPPITNAYLDNVFAGIAPYGDMRAEKRAACLNEYDRRGHCRHAPERL